MGIKGLFLAAAVTAASFLPTFAHAKSGWLKVSGRNFVVLTEMREEEAVKWATDFEQFIQTLGLFVPVDRTRLPPLTIVLFETQEDFSYYQPSAIIAGYFLRFHGWRLAAFSASSARVEEASDLSDSESYANARRTFFHEGVHWYLSGLAGVRPIWAEEGIADVFSTFRVEKDHLALGQPISWHSAMLAQFSPIPLPELLGIKRGTLFHDGSTPMRASMAYAESWAFTHMLLFGKTQLPRTAFRDLLAQPERGPTADAFLKATGQTYEQAQQLLKNYTKTGKFIIGRIPHFKIDPVKVEPAPVLDREEALARLALLLGRVELAEDHVRAMLKESPRHPRSLAMQGYLLSANGQHAKAAAVFDEALAQKPADHAVYFGAGWARERQLRRAAKVAKAPADRMSSKDARTIVNFYKRSINQNPMIEEGYEAMAELLDQLEGNLAADAPFLEQGRRLFPGNDDIALGLAVVAHRAGRTDEALAAARAIISDENCAKDLRERARKLEAKWVPPSAAGPAEAPAPSMTSQPTE